MRQRAGHVGWVLLGALLLLVELSLGIDSCIRRAEAWLGEQ